jgi:ABC-type branched-subunit amino acid transport system ATPase component
MSNLAGALAPYAGRMWIDARPYAPRTPLEARRAGLAMIYQGLSLAPHLSVMENIALGVEPVRWGLVRRDVMRRSATEALARLGHQDILPDAPVATLSPAGQQLVEIGRAIASGCRVLVLDEPTSSLGHTDVRHLFALIARLREQGHAIVYISHFIEEVKAVSDRFVVLRDGRVVGGGMTAETEASAIVHLMIGRPLDALYPKSARSPGEAVLDVQDVMPGTARPPITRLSAASPPPEQETNLADNSRATKPDISSVTDTTLHDAGNRRHDGPSRHHQLRPSRKRPLTSRHLHHVPGHDPFGRARAFPQRHVLGGLNREERMASAFSATTCARRSGARAGR